MPLKACAADPFVPAQAMDFEAFEDERQSIEDSDFVRGEPGFKVGGFPHWRQTPRALFLGNRNYVFVCAQRCRPDAVCAINQSFGE